MPWLKLCVVSIVSFIAGLAVSGFIAIKFFIYGAQSVAGVEVQFHSNVLQQISTNNIDDIVKLSCMLLPIALDNKSQYDSSFFATDINIGTSVTGENLEKLAGKHLSSSGICSQS